MIIFMAFVSQKFLMTRADGQTFIELKLTFGRNASFRLPTMARDMLSFSTPKKRGVSRAGWRVPPT